MYSGTTFRHNSGKMLGAHQKIDRVARHHLAALLPEDKRFPGIKEILHFEGNNGPDGIKRKSPARDEPWHYFDPTDPEDTGLFELIEAHFQNLVKALTDNNPERAAFEASWLAHAIVDGLTPAHHFPLEEKLEELRGEGLHTRDSLRKKILISGKGRKAVSNNWQYWGAKGIMTTHFLFEMGIATAIAPLKLSAGKPNGNECVRAQDEGVVTVFKDAAHKVHHLKMYESFHRTGWTPSLAKQAKRELAPVIVKTVALAWYVAAETANEKLKRRAKRA
jgi:hypothetical protein